MIQNVPLDPLQVGLLGAYAVVFDPNDLPDLIQQARGWGIRRGIQHDVSRESNLPDENDSRFQYRLFCWRLDYDIGRNSIDIRIKG